MHTPRRRVGRRHERSHFLVSGLDKLDLSVGAIEGAKHAVNAVARIAEEVADAPIMQTLNEKIAYGLRHGDLLVLKRRSANKRGPGDVPVWHVPWHRQVSAISLATD
jgi:hypothetical protein